MEDHAHWEVSSDGRDVKLYWGCSAQHKEDACTDVFVWVGPIELAKELQTMLAAITLHVDLSPGDSFQLQRTPGSFVKVV